MLFRKKSFIKKSVKAYVENSRKYVKQYKNKEMIGNGL